MNRPAPQWPPPVTDCIGDPNVEANWTTVGIFQGGKAIISGITPGIEPG